MTFAWVLQKWILWQPLVYKKFPWEAQKALPPLGEQEMSEGRERSQQRDYGKLVTTGWWLELQPMGKLGNSTEYSSSGDPT